jgi:hypothetical protein
MFPDLTIGPGGQRGRRPDSGVRSMPAYQDIIANSGQTESGQIRYFGGYDC